MWVKYAALAVAAIIGLIIAYLFYRGNIDEKAICNIANCIDNIVVSDSRLMMLKDYVKYAVRAVEQLVDSGMIEKKNNVRKEAAINIARNFAKANDDDLDMTDITAVENLIETEVYEMKNV